MGGLIILISRRWKFLNIVTVGEREWSRSVLEDGQWHETKSRRGKQCSDGDDGVSRSLMPKLSGALWRLSKSDRQLAIVASAI